MRGTTSLAGAAALVAVAGLLVACNPQDRIPSGHAMYQDHCAACHGPGGKGDGPVAAGYRTPLPDLSTLSARNGGTFPLRAVMAQIDGYGRGARIGAFEMPELGHLLEGPMVRVDTGDGILTPTPAKLLALAEHLESLQGATD